MGRLTHQLEEATAGAAGVTNGHHGGQADPRDPDWDAVMVLAGDLAAALDELAATPRRVEHTPSSDAR